MQNITIAGRIGSDAKLAKTQSGDSVANMSVAVEYRNGRDKATNWWRVSVWGKRAEALAPYLLKGVAITVAGEFSLGEYEGKPQLNVRASEIALQGSRNSQSDGGNGGNASRGQYDDRRGGFGDAGYSEDLNDDVPFASSDIRLERRAS